MFDLINKSLILNSNFLVFENFTNTILNSLYKNLIRESRYLYIIDGLKNTLIITLFAMLIGLAFGLIFALIRTTYENIKSLKFLNAFCKLYITVIRGTPVVLQLMILFFCIFTQRGSNGLFVAILGFGINSTAYIAEIFRSGLMSIDKGQMEAGRSLGLNYIQTMWYIIIPQAFKVVLPPLCSEFIALIKETSVAGYVAVHDLTKSGEIIKSRTYDAWTPMLIVAFIYLSLTTVLSHFVQKLERRLKANER